MIIDNNKERVLMADIRLPDNAVIATIEEEIELNELKQLKAYLDVALKREKQLQDKYKDKLEGGQELYTASGLRMASVSLIPGRKMVNVALLESMFPDAAKVCVYTGEAFKRFMLK